MHANGPREAYTSATFGFLLPDGILFPSGDVLLCLEDLFFKKNGSTGIDAALNPTGLDPYLPIRDNNCNMESTSKVAKRPY